MKPKTHIASGFSLLELMLTISLSSAILAGVLILYSPFLNEFINARNFQSIRNSVSAPLDAVYRDIADAKAFYVDGTKCYNVCFIDPTGQRVYYYFSGTSLLRKSESTNSTIACSNGKTHAIDLTAANSTFSQIKDVLSFGLYAAGTNNTSFRAYTSLFPSLWERSTLLHEGFECGTLLSHRWTLNNTALVSWALESESTSASGKYWLRETITSNQPSANVATADLALNYIGPRVTSMYLKFQYRTNGTMDAGEYLKVHFYDGSVWNEVYYEDRLVSISTLQNMVVNLSGYSLNNSNKIRFEGALLKSGDHWVIDEIEVIAQ